MGLVGLERICEQLIAHGQRPDMPVALISKGTTPEQKVVVGSLADIASKVTEHQSMRRHSQLLVRLYVCVNSYSGISRLIDICKRDVIIA